MPGRYSGKVVEVFGTSGGIMTSMDTSGIVTHLEFKIPTRGIMGLKNRIMNVTHGEGVFYTPSWSTAPMPARSATARTAP